MPMPLAQASSGMGIAHEAGDDVLHEGNLEQGPPRHFASAMTHQMRFDVDFGGGMLGICESHLRIHYLPRSTDIFHHIDGFSG
jgi:hypothetical protein